MSHHSFRLFLNSYIVWVFFAKIKNGSRFLFWLIQKAYSRSVTLFRTNMKELKKKHSWPLRPFLQVWRLTGRPSAPWVPVAPVIGSCLPLFMPSADKEKACSVHPLQVRGRPLVARRVGCGAKPCRELRRSMHSEQSGVLSWRMTYAWGAWLLRSSARRPLHGGQESPPLASLQTGRGYAHALWGVGGIPQRVDARRWERMGHRKKRKEERKPEKACK